MPGMTYCKYYPIPLPPHTYPNKDLALLWWSGSREKNHAPFVLLMNEPLVLSGDLGFLKIINIVLNFL